MAIMLKSEPVPLRMDDTGTIRVGQTRIALDLVIGRYQGGASAEEIAADYDTLDLGDVHSVIGWYLHHKEEVEQYLSERQQYEDEVWAKIESDPKQAEFRQKLIARLQKRS